MDHQRPPADPVYTFMIKVWLLIIRQEELEGCQ